MAATNTLQGSPGHASYDEIETPAAMREDCAAVGRTLHLERIDPPIVSGARTPPDADYLRAARVADALHLDPDWPPSS